MMPSSTTETRRGILVATPSFRAKMDRAQSRLELHCARLVQEETHAAARWMPLTQGAARGSPLIQEENKTLAPARRSLLIQEANQTPGSPLESETSEPGEGSPLGFETSDPGKDSPLEFGTSDQDEDENRRLLGTRWLRPFPGMRVRLSEKAPSSVKDDLDQRGIPHQTAVGTVERVRRAPSKGSMPGEVVFCDVMWDFPGGNAEDGGFLFTMHHTGRFGNYHLQLTDNWNVEERQAGATRRSSAPPILAFASEEEAVADEPDAFNSSEHREGKFNPFAKKDVHARGLATLSTFEHFRSLGQEAEAREDAAKARWAQEVAVAAEEFGAGIRQSSSFRQSGSLRQFSRLRQYKSLRQSSSL